MLLVLMPYLFNGRMTAVMASGDHQASFIKGGQQHQNHGEDELWEANFMADKRDLVSVFRCLLIQRSICILFLFLLSQHISQSNLYLLCLCTETEHTSWFLLPT